MCAPCWIVKRLVREAVGRGVPLTDRGASYLAFLYGTDGLPLEQLAATGALCGWRPDCPDGFPEEYTPDTAMLLNEISENVWRVTGRAADCRLIDVAQWGGRRDEDCLSTSWHVFALRRLEAYVLLYGPRGPVPEWSGRR